MKIVIAEPYRYLRPWLENISHHSEEGKEIYRARNKVSVTEVDGVSLNIKSFRIPNLVNRLVYATIRKSKAKRSFLYGRRLLQAGFLTPEPIAFFEKYAGILLAESYYVSTHEQFDGMLRELNYGTFEEHAALIKAFGLYTAQLHDAGILHIDYSPGNILYKKIDGQYSFYLVDLNRMKFDMDITAETACRNFRRLWGSDEMLSYFVEIYAGARGFDKAYCVRGMLHYRQRFEQKKIRKRWLKK
jgi:tRNA A-37 threonylcarbamoyl transferase component Bud32